MELMLGRQAGQRVAPQLPQPEDILLAWLAAQPEAGDLQAAVEIEIRRLTSYRGPHPGPRRLRQLFVELGRELDGAPTRRC